jgi:two-component system response regulator HydG/two-component system response regulator AtoC
VNCAAIPEGLVETELFGHEAGAFTGASGSRQGLLQSANGGTAFLDEIGDMGPAAQTKILRAIERQEVYRVGGRLPTTVDVRIVAATNQDLERAVDEGRFRKDLYFRLNVARVHLPPLRERSADIPGIVDHYLQAFNRGAEQVIEGFTPEALEALVTYDWPGNVRELRNLIEGLFVAPPPGRVRVDDLPPLFRERLRLHCRMPRADRARLLDALLAANWNKSQAAKMLHWSRMTLYRKMAKYSVVTSSPSRQANRH